MSEGKRKAYYKNPQMKQRKISFLEPGMRGFIATCNFREKECVRECYNILNQYCDTPRNDVKAPEKQNSDAEEEEEEDISKALQKEIDQQKNEKKLNKFNVADTGVPNCTFIATSLDDPVGLGVKIVRDIAATKVQKTKFLLRLIPIEMVCRANLLSITEAVGKLCDKYVLKEPHTFAIIFNKRYNNAIARDDVIKELADVVTAKNPGNKVNLTEPDYSIIVEIIKGMCCIGFLPDYLKLKKYNLLELADVSKNDSKGQTNKVTTTEGKLEDTTKAEDASNETVAKDTVEAIDVEADGAEKSPEGQ
uniref:Putative thump domain-containing protein 1 n=1 Tax=Nyssomyia neivai TaxID=330878 RepID=A0A1L8DCB8_9DIPT